MKKYLLTICCFGIALFATAQDFLPELSSKTIAVIKESVTLKGDKLQTALFSNYQQIEAGKTIKVAVLFDIQMGYCIYSNEKATSNLPTEIEWNLPKGVIVEKVVWQKPGTLPDGKKKGYIFSAIAVASIKIADDYKGSDLTISAKITYQICDDLLCEAGENCDEMKIVVGKAKKTKLYKLI